MKKQLIIAGAVILVLAGIVLGIHFFKKECITPEITFEPQKPQAGQTVSFKIKGGDNIKLTWDFSDGDTFSGVDSAIHKFENSGSYIITVVTEDNCEAQRELIVDPARKMQRVTPLVSFPPEILVGEAVTFNDATKEASEWSWNVPELNESSNFSSFTTTFPHEGIYSINLAVKGIYIKGDTTITFNVVTNHGETLPAETKVEPVTIAPTPKPEAMPKPESKARKKAEATKANAKPVVKIKPEAVSKVRPEPVAKAKPEPKVKPDPIAKPEPKPQPVAESKPKPAPKPKPMVPVYMKDAEFSSTFVEIANALGNEDNNSSGDWKDKIMAQSGPLGTMSLILIEGTNEPKVMTIENFKKQQLIATTPYNVNGVKDIKRKKDNSIYQITIIVTKN